MFNPFKALFRPNFGLIVGIGIVAFIFSGQLFPQNLDCQTINCAKASELVKTDQFWQENQDKIINFGKNIPNSQTPFSLPWTSEKSQESSESSQKVDTGIKTEDIAKILGDQNLFEEKKNDYHNKVLFLLENSSAERQKKLCGLNLGFIATSKAEAQIQVICQKFGSQGIQGINEGLESNLKTDIFHIPEEYLR